MGRSHRTALVVALVATFGLMVGGPAASAPSYQVRSERALGAGVTWRSMGAPDPDLSIQLAHVPAGADVRLVPVISNDAVFENPPARRTELTTAMCARVNGMVCVNADFSTSQSAGAPLGAFVLDGRLLRSPDPDHEQVSLVGGRLTTDKLVTRHRLVSIVEPEPDPLGDPLAPAPAPSETVLEIDEVNRTSGGGLTLYTPNWATTTQTGDPSTEVRFAGAVPRLGAAAEASVLGQQGANATIPKDGYVVAGSGDAATELTDFLNAHPDDARLELRLAANFTPDMSVGGHPVILRDGQRVAQNMNDGKVRNRHPRTLIGWNDAGDTFVVAIDGRRPGHSVGVTIAEAADYLQHLGATHALNLDGGGSTTFATKLACADGTSPCVRNRPSDGGERFVSSALAVVPNDPNLQAPPLAPPVTAAAPPPPPPTTAPPPPPTTAPPVPSPEPEPAPVEALSPEEPPALSEPEPANLPRTAPAALLPVEDGAPSRTLPALAATGLIAAVVGLQRLALRAAGTSIRALWHS